MSHIHIYTYCCLLLTGKLKGTMQPTTPIGSRNSAQVIPLPIKDRDRSQKMRTKTKAGGYICGRIMINMGVKQGYKHSCLPLSVCLSSLCLCHSMSLSLSLSLCLYVCVCVCLSLSVSFSLCLPFAHLDTSKWRPGAS